MRPFPAAERGAAGFFLLFAGALLLALASPALAQQAAAPVITPSSLAAPSPASMATLAQTPVDRKSFLQGMQAALQMPGLDATAQQQNQQQQQQDNSDLGSATDPNSPLYKANQLAEQAMQDRKDAASFNIPGSGIIAPPPPPALGTLENITQTNAGGAAIADDAAVSKAASLDMRRDAQREAALSYGARGGLASRNYQIMERMQGFGPVLDHVFNFRALLVRAPSGLMIEPPIVKESVDALKIADGGNEAAVADRIYDINKQAKIVSAPRDWREYLLQTWGAVPPPPRVLWPKNAAEQAAWNRWVERGWRAGIEQADQIFETNVNQLVADFDGMVRYRMLLDQGMISAPYALAENRGVTGDKNQMRIGDRAIRITGPSQFLMGAELWKPADR